MIITTALIFLLVPLIIYLLFTTKKSLMGMMNSTLLMFFVGLSFIPIFHLNLSTSSSVSLINLITRGQDQVFLAMIIFYIISILLIALGNKYYKFSLISFLIGYASIFLSKSLGVLVPSQNVSTPFFWFYIFTPAISLILYIGMITSEKETQNYLENQDKKQKELAKIGFKAQLIPVLIAITLSLFYTISATYLSDTFHCLNSIDCKAWGDSVSKSVLFGLSSFLFFDTIGIALGKGSLKGESKVARYSLIPVFLLFIVGNYAGFKIYVKTTQAGIESSDISNLLSGPVSIKWDQVMGYGIQKYMYRGSCKVEYSYLILAKNQQSDLPTSVNRDQSFFDFLNKRGINLKDIKSHCY